MGGTLTIKKEIKLLKRGGWLTALEGLSERGRMDVICCTVLRQHCFISALQKQVPHLVFGFTQERDNTSSSVTHCFTKQCIKISVSKISYCKMSFLLLADLHKSWKRTNCFTARQLLTFIVVVYEE